MNGASGTAPVVVEATLDTPVVLDASGTRDPDGHALSYRWWFYPEAGTGIPGRPVVTWPRAGSAACRDERVAAGRARRA